MRIAVEQEIKHVIRCPFCGKGRWPVDHILAGQFPTFGPWMCDDCGRSFRGTFDGVGIDIEPHAATKEPTSVLLYRDGVALVVDGWSYSWSEEGGPAYYYDQHTCPINYLRDCAAVLDLENNNSDPHGLFRYVAETHRFDPDELGSVDDILAKFHVTRDMLAGQF